MTERKQDSGRWVHFIAEIKSEGGTQGRQSNALGIARGMLRSWIERGPPSSLQRIAMWPPERQRRILDAIRHDLLLQKKPPASRRRRKG